MMCLELAHVAGQCTSRSWRAPRSTPGAVATPICAENFAMKVADQGRESFEPIASGGRWIGKR